MRIRHVSVGINDYKPAHNSLSLINVTDPNLQTVIERSLGRQVTRRIRWVGQSHVSVNIRTTMNRTGIIHADGMKVIPEVIIRITKR